jgi:urease accessory protein
MQLIRQPLATCDPTLKEVALRVDRQKLATRLWRATADDGAEFGFELETPLKDGQAVWQSPVARYVICQDPEPVLEVSLQLAASAAAGIGWAIGNLHMELMAEANRLLAPDDPAMRQLLERLEIPFTATATVFRPGRFARGTSTAEAPSHELGPSHRH